MRTTKTLKPGQDGTKKLLARFGRDLLCVRYRYDEARREHLKTVELVVERRAREGELGCQGSRAPAGRAPSARPHAPPAGGFAARPVALRIHWRERDLRQRVKSAGGRWDPDRQVWMLRRDVAERLDLMRRAVGGGV